MAKTARSKPGGRKPAPKPRTAATPAADNPVFKFVRRIEGDQVVYEEQATGRSMRVAPGSADLVLQVIETFLPDAGVATETPAAAAPEAAKASAKPSAGKKKTAAKASTGKSASGAAESAPAEAPAAPAGVTTAPSPAKGAATKAKPPASKAKPPKTPAVAAQPKAAKGSRKSAKPAEPESAAQPAEGKSEKAKAAPAKPGKSKAAPKSAKAPSSKSAKAQPRKAAAPAVTAPATGEASDWKSALPPDFSDDSVGLRMRRTKVRVDPSYPTKVLSESQAKANSPEVDAYDIAIDGEHVGHLLVQSADRVVLVAPALQMEKTPHRGFRAGVQRIQVTATFFRKQRQSAS